MRPASMIASVAAVVALAASFYGCGGDNRATGEPREPRVSAGNALGDEIEEPLPSRCAGILEDEMPCRVYLAGQDGVLPRTLSPKEATELATQLMLIDELEARADVEDAARKAEEVCKRTVGLSCVDVLRLPVAP